MMNLGALATVATQQPENLAIVVLDNEKYGETGNQASAHQLRATTARPTPAPAPTSR